MLPVWLTIAVKIEISLFGFFLLNKKIPKFGKERGERREERGEKRGGERGGDVFLMRTFSRKCSEQSIFVLRQHVEQHESGNVNFVLDKPQPLYHYRGEAHGLGRRQRKRCPGAGLKPRIQFPSSRAQDRS
jgi:hypothetical protein